MTHIDVQDIKQLFGCLNRSGVDWLLLRNTNDELPDSLNVGKDVDILVRPSGREEMKRHLQSGGYRPVRHPAMRDTKLYGITEFDYFSDACGLFVDINYELVVRSLDRGQWMPLDKVIQHSVWENSRKVILAGNEIYTLGDEDLYVATLSRCVFDKNEFTEWHQMKLDQLFSGIDVQNLKQKLELIFFGYSDRLMELLENSEYSRIYDDYIAFSEY